jgi:hypothetical protein
MAVTMKLMSIILPFSTLFAGCYSSELIDLNGEDRQETHSTEQRTYPSEIEYVVTRDGKQYHFGTPPTIIKDSIVNIRSTEIDYVITREGTKHMFENVTETVITPVEKVKAKATAINYVITTDGIKYMFEEETTAVVNDTIVGVLKAKTAADFADDPTEWITSIDGTRMSIALSDVVQVRTSEKNTTGTAGVFVVGLYIVVTLVSITSIRIHVFN